jgi:hypothetical protein
MAHDLYNFRFFDRVRGRWVRGRYRATIETLRATYERFETIGEPEIRADGDLYDDATSRIVGDSR